MDRLPDCHPAGWAAKHPADLYEVAKIDGANAWTAFWRITLPLLTPVIMVVVVLSEGGGFNLFDLPYG